MLSIDCYNLNRCDLIVIEDIVLENIGNRIVDLN